MGKRCSCTREVVIICLSLCFILLTYFSGGHLRLKLVAEKVDGELVTAGVTPKSKNMSKPIKEDYGEEHLAYLSQFYHNTLIVDHLLPEDLSKSYGAQESGTLKARYASSEQSYRSLSSSRPQWSTYQMDLESPEKNVTILQKYFPAAFNCPFRVERLGRVDQKGKWVCGLELFESDPRPQECVIYLFGKGNEEYLRQLVHRTDCHIRYFIDEKGEKPSIEHRKLTVIKNILGNEDKGITRTLGETMKDNGHGFIDILIMNIEGREFLVLSQIMKETDEVLPFGQLLVEVEVPHPVKNVESFKLFAKKFEELERRGLRPFHADEVSSKYAAAEEQQTPSLKMEYSFINIRGMHILLTGKE